MTDLGRIAAFGLGGAAWGIVARFWMRLVSNEPEFTWSGTLFIIGLFAVVGVTQGCAFVVHRRRWSRLPQLLVRVPAGIIAVFLLGGGAGIVMLPALLCAPPALARTGWPRAVRAGLALLAGLNVVAMLWLLVDELGSTQGIIGWLVMLVVYGVIIGVLSLNLRPRTVDAPHLPGGRSGARLRIA